jgi:hypothetical protein
VFLAGEDAEAAIAEAPLDAPDVARLAGRRPRGGHVRYEVVRSIDGRPLRLVRDDATLEPALKSLVDALFALEPPASEPTRFAVDLAKSTIEVRTGSSGILSAFGHDHRLMVRRFSGTVERSVAPETWTLALEVEAGSLAVVDDESQDRRDRRDERWCRGRAPSAIRSARQTDVGALEGAVGLTSRATSRPQPTARIRQLAPRRVLRDGQGEPSPTSRTS